MEIKISRTELLKVISIIEKGIPSKTVIDSLKGIKIEAKNGNLIFTTSKADLAITCVVEQNFEVISEGVILIPGQQFSTIVKKSTDEEFLIKQDDKGVLVKSKRSKMNLLQYDVSSYPVISFDTNTMSHFTINKATFIKTYNHTHHAVATNAIKPILQGINYKINDTTLTVGATDARRLAISSLTLENPVNEELNFTMPRHLVADVLKIIEAAKCDEFEIYVDKNLIIIVAGSLTIKTRLQEGEYPAITRLLPTSCTYSYVVNASEIMGVIEKVILLASRDASNITTSIEDNKLTLSSDIREIGYLEEECEVRDVSGSPFKISFDPHFLSSAIAAIGEEELELKMVDEVSAFSITGVKNKDNIQVISPLKMG